MIYWKRNVFEDYYEKIHFLDLDIILYLDYYYPFFDKPTRDNARNIALTRIEELEAEDQ